MKIKCLRFTLFSFLCLLLVTTVLETGCKKEDINSKYIIGKWEWVYSFGGIAGNTIYPEDGQTIILEFLEDSTLIQYENNEKIFESTFTISKDTLRYTRGSEIECTFDISSNTLSLMYFNSDDAYNPSYKRIK